MGSRPLDTEIACAATVIASPHDRQVYPLYGPVELDYDGIAAKVATALGFPVRYEPVDIDTFADVLRLQGRDEYFIQQLTNVAQDYRNGIFAGTNNLVEVITGTPALIVEQIADANRGAFATTGQASAWEKVHASPAE